MVIKDVNNNKRNSSQRMKTNEDKKEGDLIDASRVEIEEKNNTFQKEKIESDFWIYKIFCSFIILFLSFLNNIIII